ncbi:hypothetical protein BDP27DRAFT_1365452 [Rhodocollybia butyracea]|uniref:DUF4246 domain-containing protein n=1 Tax=Rhodocollybia butyracea TaxID=206335 RepID=A0A9P5PNV9_9AGAR|nr:hypothetical protein BDP27DRAFT_1365452 [Rhodocollybia butyracea]
MNVAASEMYKGREMKVIVEVLVPVLVAANYKLMPGPEYEGLWHMEGMPHERIVASVIYYYYDTDGPILDGGSSFRKFRPSGFDFPSPQEYTSEITDTFGHTTEYEVGGTINWQPKTAGGTVIHSILKHHCDPANIVVSVE